MASPQMHNSGNIAKAGMTMAIIVACIMVIGLIPCLGWLNWFTLLLGLIAKILSWVAVFTEGQNDLEARKKAVIGVIVASVAAFIGGIRLVLGGGLC